MLVHPPPCSWHKHLNLPFNKTITRSSSTLTSAAAVSLHPRLCRRHSQPTCTATIPSQPVSSVSHTHFQVGRRPLLSAPTSPRIDFHLSPRALKHRALSKTQSYFLAQPSLHEIPQSLHPRLFLPRLKLPRTIPLLRMPFIIALLFIPLTL